MKELDIEKLFVYLHSESVENRSWKTRESAVVAFKHTSRGGAVGSSLGS